MPLVSEDGNPAVAPVSSATDINKPSVKAADWSYLALLLLPLLVLAAAYYPSMAPFGLHNDYSFLEPNTRVWWQRFDESWWLYRIGRPLGGLLLSAQCLLMKSPQSFVYWRVAAVISLAGLALLFARLLTSRAGYSRSEGVLMGTFLMMLPAMQLSVMLLTTLAQGVVASGLGLLAYLILPDTIASGKNKDIVSSLAAFPLRHSAALVLLICAMLVYPTNALLGLAVTTAIILNNRTFSEVLPTVVRDCFLSGLAMCLYFILIKTIFIPMSGGGVSLPEYQVKLMINPIEQVTNFFSIMAVVASSPWSTVLGSTGGQLFNLILCGAGYILLKKQFAGLDLRRRIFAVSSLLLIIIIFVNVPLLLAPKAFFNVYRTSFVSQVIFWLVIYSLVKLTAESAREVVRYIAVGVLCTAVFTVFCNSILVRNNGVMELTRIKNALSQAIAEQRDILYVLKPRGTSYSNWPVQFEFALPITHRPHMAGILADQSASITSSGVNIGVVDEDGNYHLLHGNKSTPNFTVLNMKLLDSSEIRMSELRK